MSDADSGMDLKTFIASALTQIVEGVEDARDKLQAHSGGAKVNPVSGFANDKEPAKVRFDIAVSATAKNEKGRKGGIRVLSFEVGGQAGSEVSTETVSRIQFEVPIALPRSDPSKWKQEPDEHRQEYAYTD